MCKTTQEVGSQKRQGQMQMWTEYKPWRAQIEIRCESNRRRTEYEQGNSATDCKEKFGNEKNFHINGALNLDTLLETSASHFF